jgi:SAM-dependent methyltransferase
MKFKSAKELYKIFYGKNYDNLYRGFSGWLFSLAHKNLEKKINNNNSYFILEIGPGRFPHFEYIVNRHLIKKYYFYETNINNIVYLKKKYRKHKNIFFLKNINQLKKNSLDRIICSHVLEHVSDVDYFILKIFSYLKINGFLSITLPCDPGFLWDLGREINFYKFWKKKGVTKKMYFYHMAKEHVNSVRNLKRIFYYYFENITESYLPFKIKLFNFNLFYNVTIKK